MSQQAIDLSTQADPGSNTIPLEKIDLISMLIHGEATKDIVNKPMEFLGNVMLLKRFETVELVGEPVRVRSNFVRGYSDLPVRVHPLS